MIKLRFDYNKDVIDVIKAFGGKWNVADKSWLIESTNAGLLRGVLSKEFPDVDISMINVAENKSNQRNNDICDNLLDNQLRNYQKNGVLRSVLSSDGYLFAYEMGLGKSATTIAAIMSGERTGKILIACPGIVRYTWMQQLERWGVTAQGVKAVIYDPKTKAKLKKNNVDTMVAVEEARIFITSYNLLDDFLLTNVERGFELPDIQQFGIYVFDEAHWLSNFKSGWSRTAQALREVNPDAYCYALTGTPARDEIYDIFTLLKIVQPNHWGNYYAMVKRYCELRADKYSEWNIVGLNKNRIGELMARVEQCSHRVTKQEVADQLPPMSFIPVWIDEKKRSANKLEQIDDINAWLLNNGYNKVDYIVDWVTEFVNQNNGKLCVAMYHYAVADEVCKQLKEKLVGTGFEVDYVNGHMSQEQRISMIKQAADKKNSILLVTMESIKIGINDLKAYDKVLLGELHWSPEVMAQVMARFHRLDSVGAVDIYALIMKGTKDADMAETLQSKIDVINNVVKSGSIEDKLRLSLISDNMSEVQIQSAWADIKASEEEDYV